MIYQFFLYTSPQKPEARLIQSVALDLHLLRQMQHSVGPERLHAFFGTMNCGNALIDELPWVPKMGRDQSSQQYDIVVITMQECLDHAGPAGLVKNFLEQPKHALTGGKDLLVGGSRLAKILHARLGRDYTLVADLMLCAMRLVVMVLARHAVSSVESAVEATGALHVVGNKGALVAKLELCGTSLCFVGAHLAAHGQKVYLERRNQDVREIMNGIKLGNQKLDLTQFDHCETIALILIR
jgi:hypothetical protein